MNHTDMLLNEKRTTDTLYSFWAAMILHKASASVIEASIVPIIQQLIHVALQVTADHRIATKPYSKL